MIRGTKKRIPSKSETNFLKSATEEPGVVGIEIAFPFKSLAITTISDFK